MVTTVCSLAAISLAVGASNSTLFRSGEGQQELSSLADSRGIASIEEAAPLRDPAWEKSIADSLSSVELRDLASIAVGHEATLDEKVRYGVLERKYTILRDLKRNEVESVILQGAGTEPTMLRNRADFLGQFGKWMSDKYASAQLDSAQAVITKDRRIEYFTVYDASHKAYAKAKFELDNFQRLLSLTFERL